MIKSGNIIYLGKAQPEGGSGGGGSAVIETLNVTPTTSPQIITAPSGTDGYNPVNVSAISDENLIPENIKSGTTILGVTGNAVIKNGTVVEITTTGYTYPPAGYNCLNYVNVRMERLGVDITKLIKVFDNGYQIAPRDSTQITIDGSGITQVFTGGLSGVFNRFQIKGMDFSDLIKPEPYSFQNCCSEASFNFNNVIVDFSNIEYMKENAFRRSFYNTRWKSDAQILFTKLKTMNDTVDYYQGDYGLYEAFACDADYYHKGEFVTSFTFQALENVNAQYSLSRMFANRTSLQSLSFPALLSTGVPSADYLCHSFDDMLIGITGCTVHFPSNLQTVMSNLSQVTNGFGGTNTTVLFDLPATSA